MTTILKNKFIYFDQFTGRELLFVRVLFLATLVFILFAALFILANAASSLWANRMWPTVAKWAKIGGAVAGSGNAPTRHNPIPRGGHSTIVPAPPKIILRPLPKPIGKRV